MSVLNSNNLLKSKTTHWGAIGAALQVLAAAFTSGTVTIPVIITAATTLLMGLFAGDAQPTEPAPDPEKKQ